MTSKFRNVKNVWTLRYTSLQSNFTYFPEAINDVGFCLGQVLRLTPQVNPSIFPTVNLLLEAGVLWCSTEMSHFCWEDVGCGTQNKTQHRCFIEEGGLRRALCTGKIMFSWPDLLSFLQPEALKTSSQPGMSSHRDVGGNLGCLNMAVDLFKAYDGEPWSLPYKG